MAGEWPTVTVGDLAESISETHKFGKDHLVFLNTSDVLLGKLLHHSYSAVRDWPGQAKKSIRKDDILFSEIRPANGRWAYVDIVADDYVVSTKLMVIRSRTNGVLPRFLYHFLTGIDTTRWLQHLAESRSGTFPQITFDQVAELELSLPPLDAQVKIAEFLDALDDKIELNRRMNEMLEAMARALFQSWFVDFDPVRAKSEGRDPDLPQALADLFAARLVDSELGETPEGWEVGTFSDAVEVLRDQENPLESPGTLFHHFSIPAFDSSQWPKEELGESIKSLKSRVPPGVVLLSKLNPEIERVWFVDVKPNDRALCSTEFLVLRPRPPAGRSFAYCLARSPVLRQEIEGLVTGTSKSHQRAQANSILGLGVVRPPATVVEAFERTAGSWLERTVECRLECRTLAALRNTLLPRLISGELRVRDAERNVEVA